MRILGTSSAMLLLSLAACQEVPTEPDGTILAVAHTDLVDAALVMNGEPVVRRIEAVTHAVLAVNEQVGRVIIAWPPNPCTEIGPACDAAFAANVAYSALGQSVADVCAGGPPSGPALDPGRGGAAGGSDAGLAGRLVAVASAMAGAVSRFSGIYVPSPGPPDLPWVPDPGPPEAPVAQALNALSAVVYEGGASLTGWLGGAFDYLPNPCVVG